MVSDWTVIVPVEHVRRDAHTRKSKARMAKSLEEHLLLADFALYFDRPTGRYDEPYEAVEVIVPKFARVSLFRTGHVTGSGLKTTYDKKTRLDTWEPDKVLETLAAAKLEAQRKGARLFRRANDARTFVCFIKFRVAAADTLITVFDDGTVRYRQMDVHLNRVA